jgi:hypothetical protein
MIKTMKRYINNFKEYTFKNKYMEEHPDGRSCPSLTKRLYIFWKLKNEPTLNERLDEWRNLQP